MEDGQVGIKFKRSNATQNYQSLLRQPNDLRISPLVASKELKRVVSRGGLVERRNRHHWVSGVSGCETETLNRRVENGESAQPDKGGQQLEAKVYGRLLATIKICHVNLLIGRVDSNA